MRSKLERFFGYPVVQYALIIILAAILAVNYKLFIVPNKFAPSGFNGIVTMIQYKTGFSIGYGYLLINVPLCLFAFFSTDRKFALRTFVFAMCYSAFYIFLQQIDTFSIEYNAQGVDTIFPCLIAGVLTGVIYGLAFQVNSSTGGVDIIAKYISKKKPMMNFFWVTFFLGAAVAVASYFVYAEEIDGVLVYDYKPVCLCVLYSFVSSFVGNRILQGSKSAFHFVIITTHTKEIEHEIITSLRHSATQIVATGAYSGEEKDVLMCVVNKHQINDLKDILKKYDNTFSFIEPVHETVGNFKSVK